LGNSGLKHLSSPDSGAEDKVYGDDWEDLVDLLDLLLNASKKFPYSSLALTNSLLNADVAVGAAIAEAKLNLNYATHAENHKARHVAGGADAFAVSDTLNCLARIDVKKAGASQGQRRGLNFIQGAGATITVADDAGNEEVDVTIGLSGGGGGGRGEFAYHIYKDGATWYAMARDGSTPYSSGSGIGGLINSCIAAGGRTFLLEEGTHTVETKINLNQNNILLMGLGWGTILSAGSGLNTHVIEITGDTCTVMHLGVDGNKGSQTSGCGIYEHSSNVTLFHLNVYDVEDDGIRCGESYPTWNQDSMGGKISHCRISSCDGNGLLMDYTATDYEVMNMLINTCESTGMAGLAVNGSNCRYTNFHIWGCYFDLNIAFSGPVRGLSFTNMGFMDNRHHVVYKASNYYAKDLHFTGCTFWGKRSGGSETNRDGFFAGGSGTCVGWTVTGCTFRGDNDADTKQGRYAINWGTTVEDSVVVGNTFSGWVQADPVNVDEIENDVAHNSFFNNGS
jgi:hypothetical protein